MSIETVQHWVITLLIFAITSFPMGAMVFVSNIYYRDGRIASAIGMCIMCGVIGLIAVAAMRLIHRRSPISPLLLLGLLPSLGTALAMWKA